MKSILFFLSINILFIGCTQMDQIESIEYKLLDWETADFSSLTKFDPMMESFEGLLSVALDKNLIFHVASISYPTVDPNGEHVWASGLVYHPLNRKSKGVIDFMPMAHLNRDAGNKQDLYITEGMLALLGYTVIFPDLIGSGSSKDKMVPFLMVDNTGRVAYDMHRAAAQYLWNQFGYQLPAETVVMGYSLGGSAALATQKYYETYHSNTIKIKEVHAGGGAYDLPVAFEAYAQSGVSEYPAIPHAIIAFDHYYHLQSDFSNLFKGLLLQNYQTWLHGTYTADTLKVLLGTNLHDYLHDDFFKPVDQQNETIKKFHPLLVENSVTEGWRPKAPIYITYATADAIIPAACAESAAKKLRKAGGNVSCTGYPGDHYTVGYLFFIRAMIHSLL